jgi:hypothetical protein
MFSGIMSGLTTWLHQVSNILSREMAQLSPREYSIGLILCICIGFVLLRGRN